MNDQATMMDNQDNNIPNVTHTRRHSPPLRFPQFHDEWTETKLADIAEIVKGKGLSKADIGSHGRECILYGELYTIYNTEVIHTVHSRTLSIPQGAVQSVSNDVLIPSSGESAEDIAVARYLPYSGILLGGDLNIIRLYKDSGLFLAYELNGIRRKDISQIAQGSSVVHLYAKTLANLSLSLPGLAEQEKIAGFLSLIDQRISSQSKIIDGLNDLKRGLITHVIDQANWEWTSLEEKVESGEIELKRGNIIPKHDYSEEYIYPVYSSSVKNEGLMGYYNSYMFDCESITWSIDGGGHFFYRDIHKYNVTNVAGIMKLNTSKYDYLFIKEVLSNQHGKLLFDYQSKAHPSVIPALYQIPEVDIIEQRKLSRLFASVSKKLKLEERLLQCYQEQKKYLLSKLFV